MALLPAKFTEGSGGHLQAEWFALTAGERADGTYADAADKLSTLLTSWIDAAVTLGHATGSSTYDETDAGTAYVYVRAFRFVSRLIGFAPAEGSADDVASYRFSQWQIDHINEALAEWEETLESVTDTTPIPLTASSQLVTREAIWYK